MTLGELIQMLAAADQDLVLPQGFGNPHSHRGAYENIAFEPERNVPVRNMLEDARLSVGVQFQGWKGGDFTMRGDTDCWLAHEGESGEPISRLLMQLLLGGGRKP